MSSPNISVIHEFYDRMERQNILLSFKGNITSELLTAVLQIMENKLDAMNEENKIKKKVYNVLVECLQNLYHHLDIDPTDTNKIKYKSALFMIGKTEDDYHIFTGNHIQNNKVDSMRARLEKINGMTKEELKEFYKEVLNEGEFSDKGGGGLGMIDIARKSGQKLEFAFDPVDDRYSFFSLKIRISQ